MKPAKKAKAKTKVTTEEEAKPKAPQTTTVTKAKTTIVAKKPAEKKERPQKQAKAAGGTPKVKAVRPQGVAPDPMVKVRHLHSDSMHERVASGYSILELSGAGLALNDALRWEVPTDPRRRSSLDENVERLKAWLQSK